MDLQKIIDSMKMTSCIVSVEKRENAEYGTIRLVCGNKAYVDSIENNPNAPQLNKNKFIPGSPYTDYLPKDLNFEHACYQAAVLGQPIHSYARPDRFDFWFNMFFIPVESDDEKLGYCIYSMEFSKEIQSEKMSEISGKTSSDVLETCIKLRGSNDFAATMQEVVQDIRIQCKSNYCCILQMDFNNRVCQLLGESLGDEFADHQLNYKANWLGNEFFELAETWRETIAGSNCLIIKNQSDMEFIKEKNPTWYASLKEAKVNSIVLFPLISHDNLLGYIWATNFDTEDAEDIKETLELTTFFLASEISNHQLLENMQIMSSIDVLTGVYNRNWMNTVVDKIRENPNSSKSIGIFFIDVNGLKTVNDKEGHYAGDMLIKNAALALQKVFVQNEIFRAGGDEFMVIIMNAKEDDLQPKALELKKVCQIQGVSLSAGWAWDSNSSNILSALKIADERMYADKDAYYKATGLERRE